MGWDIPRPGMVRVVQDARNIPITRPERLRTWANAAETAAITPPPAPVSR